MSASDRGAFALFAALALGLGELGDGVAAKGTFERDARLVPYLTRRAKRRVVYVAVAPGRAPGGPDLTVQNLYYVEYRYFFARYRKAISTVRPAMALQNASAPQITEDLLEEPFRYSLTVRDVGDANRRTTLI